MATLYHAPHARSLRVLWTLEELGAKADVKTLPFPPREKQPDYLKVNPTGAIPAMVDGDRVMTESLAICEYLAAKHGSSLLVAPGEPERVPFLEWLWYGESTLMTPLSRLGRVASLPVKGEAIDVVLADARESLLVRLKSLEQRLEGRDFLVAGRLTLADVSVGYPLHLIAVFGIDMPLGTRTAAYRERLRTRPAFVRAAAIK
ncbi:Glutathione S-transferase, N-terminal domain [Rhodospirillales bacterium URHD0017]|nr:Glutathione S-transferase, N-terminal domain [Rhodospirillales bacterium URHD0017]